MFAYDYPLLGFFWTVLIVFIWVAWIILLIRVFSDLFRNHEMGGFAKALWVIFVIIVPFLGVLIYLIAHGSGMAKRDIASAKAQQEQFDAYVRQTAGDQRDVERRRDRQAGQPARPGRAEPTPSSPPRRPSCSPDPRGPASAGNKDRVLFKTASCFADCRHLLRHDKRSERADS